MVKSVGIIGANGYTGSELVRVLAFHPNAELKFLYSRSNAGTKISEIYPDLTNICEMSLTNQTQEVEILFLCLPHQESKKWLMENPVKENVLIIDIGNDFRLEGGFQQRNFIYGLPELYKNELKSAKSISNPGCFATAIQLALLPLANENLLKDVYTTGITGATGAGQALSSTTHFTWRHDNISAYKSLTHQHVEEILKTLNPSNENNVELHFVPWRGDFVRGIFTSSIFKCDLELEEIQEKYFSFYKNAPFVTLAEKPIDLKQVINTNRCVIYIEKNKGAVVVHSAIDNLLKGASGQAVQNMNIAMDWEENTGLNLKPIAF